MFSSKDIAEYIFFLGDKLSTALQPNILLFDPLGLTVFLSLSNLNSIGVIDTNSLLLGTLLYTQDCNTDITSLLLITPSSLLTSTSPSTTKYSA